MSSPGRQTLKCDSKARGPKNPLQKQTSTTKEDDKKKNKVSTTIVSSSSKIRTGNKRDFSTAHESLWKEPEKWDPFLVISPINTDKKLTDIPFFKKMKILEQMDIENISNATNLKSGEIMIQVKNATDSTKLKSCTSFGGFPVKVTAHRTLNTSKGVIKCKEFNGSTKEEIIEGIEGVTDARQVKIRRFPREILTNTWILTFDSPKPPSVIIVKYLRLHVRPYIPNPMRCYYCQKYGHTKEKCKGKRACPKCGKQDHFEHCKSSPWCPNCQQSGHTAASKDCERWKYEKSVLQYKAQNGGTFTQARAALSFFQPSPTGKKSYATVAKEFAQSSKQATVAKELAQSSKPYQFGDRKADERNSKIRPNQVRDRKRDAQDLGHRPNQVKDKSKDAQKFNHKQSHVKDKKQKHEPGILNKTGKEEMQALPAIKTKNPFDLLSQPVITESERMDSDTDAYLSSSLPDMEIDIHDPPTLTPICPPMSWADQTPFPDDEEEDFLSPSSSPKEENLVAHKSPKHSSSDQEKSKQKEDPPSRSLFKEPPSGASSQTNSYDKNQESRQKTKNLSFGSTKWENNIHQKKR